MSNVIKSNYVDYSCNQKVVIDANKSVLITKMEEMYAKRAEYSSSADGFVLGLHSNSVELNESVAVHEQPIEVQELNEAKNQVELMLKEAMEEAKEHKAKAIEEGRQEGYELGSQEGYESGQSRLQEELDLKLQQMEQSFLEKEEELIKSFEEERKKLEPEFAALTARLVEKITGVVVTEHKNVILHIMNQALKETENSRNFLIKVSDEDYSYVLEHQNEIYGILNPGITLEIFRESRLVKNQCIIEMDSGLIDCSLGEQLIGLKQSLQLLGGMD